LKRQKQDHSKATYFGKRTSDDGLINWDWQKNRIYNWVRAQANPYPGAFGFVAGSKYIIDEVRYSEMGFNSSIPNGKIIGFNKNNPIVKVQNGSIELSKIRNNNINLSIDECFSN
jgi:methionyl-tRNA formyltransferase